MSITFTAYKEVSPKTFNFVEGAPELNLANGNAFEVLSQLMEPIVSQDFGTQGPETPFEMDYCGSLTADQLSHLYKRLRSRQTIRSFSNDTSSYMARVESCLLELCNFVRENPDTEFGWG